MNLGEPVTVMAVDDTAYEFIVKLGYLSPSPTYNSLTIQLPILDSLAEMTHLDIRLAI